MRVIYLTLALIALASFNPRSMAMAAADAATDAGRANDATATRPTATEKRGHRMCFRLDQAGDNGDADGVMLNQYGCKQQDHTYKLEGAEYWDGKQDPTPAKPGEDPKPVPEDPNNPGPIIGAPPECPKDWVACPAHFDPDGKRAGFNGDCKEVIEHCPGFKPQKPNNGGPIHPDPNQPGGDEFRCPATEPHHCLDPMTGEETFKCAQSPEKCKGYGGDYPDPSVDPEPEVDPYPEPPTIDPPPPGIPRLECLDGEKPCFNGNMAVKCVSTDDDCLADHSLYEKSGNKHAPAGAIECRSHEIPCFYGGDIAMCLNDPTQTCSLHGYSDAATSTGGGGGSGSGGAALKCATHEKTCYYHDEAAMCLKDPAGSCKDHGFSDTPSGKNTNSGGGGMGTGPDGNFGCATHMMPCPKICNQGSTDAHPCGPPYEGTACVDVGREDQCPGMENVETGMGGPTGGDHGPPPCTQAQLDQGWMMCQPPGAPFKECHPKDMCEEFKMINGGMPGGSGGSTGGDHGPPPCTQAQLDQGMMMCSPPGAPFKECHPKDLCEEFEMINGGMPGGSGGSTGGPEGGQCPPQHHACTVPGEGIQECIPNEVSCDMAFGPGPGGPGGMGGPPPDGGMGGPPGGPPH